METVDGYRAGSQIYVDTYGHLYSLELRRNAQSYYKCRVRECPGRAVMKENENPRVTVPHNHLPNEEELEMCRFKTLLRRRAATENTSLADIYAQAELQYPRAAFAVGGIRGVRSLMTRSRQAGTPPIPRSIREYAEFLDDDRWKEKYATELGPARNPFYRKLAIADDGSASIIFCSPRVLEYVARGAELELNMDATFKVVPRQGAGSQLFMIHVFYEGSVYPVVYALMERKSTAAYVSVLGALVELAPNVNIRSVMADYEAALRQAIRNVFPAAQLLGCWFHYARAVHKKAAALHLVRRDDEVGQRILKMAMALPLLPEHLVAQGLREIEIEAAELVEMVPFLRYIRTNWLPVRISVYRLPQRTNNSVESFHRDLMRIVSREHPNIWVFTECILRVEHTKASDFHRSLLEVGRPRKRRLVYRQLNDRISLAQNRLDEDGNVRRFILHMSHSMNRLGGYLEVVNANDNECDDGSMIENYQIPVPQHPNPPAPQLALPFPTLARSPPPLAPLSQSPPPLAPLSHSPPPLAPLFHTRPPSVQPRPIINLTSPQSPSIMLPTRPAISRVRRRNLHEYLRGLVSGSSSSSSDEDIPAPLEVRAEVHDRQSPEPEPLQVMEEELFPAPEPVLEIEIPFLPPEIEEEEPPLPPVVDVPEPFWLAMNLVAGQDANPEWHAEGVDEDWQGAGENESTVNLTRLRCPVCYTSVNRYALECGHVLCGFCAETVYTSDPRCPICRTPILTPPRRFLL